MEMKMVFRCFHNESVVWDKRVREGRQFQVDGDENSGNTTVPTVNLQ